ncbi:nucleotide-diphospho-sugar transferase [Choanephora cucurbitarum]|nr:nucleotide-diphospho-sugar transferase [Choanephora cucurbitarum]
MVFLRDNPFSSSDTNSSSKSSYNRRRTWKILFRISVATVVLTTCYFIGRGVHWEKISESYNPRDIDFSQYICNLPQTTLSKLLSSSSLAAIQQQQLSNANLLEHQRIEYLKSKETLAPDVTIPKDVWNGLPVKGAYYMVVRNEKIMDARMVARSMEDHMKNGTQYPWVLLNNQLFTMEFKKHIKKVITAPVFFGKIDLEAWDYPHWIDVDRAEFLMLEQETKGAYKGSSLSYHQLMRYHSGFFFHHPLLRDVEYTWRVEPGADYSCQMDDDMFLYMKEHNKSLGFVITMLEASQTIPTLWQRVNEFTERFPQHVLPEYETIYPWIYDEDADDYNNCHFWTNFQLADLSFFRSESYRKYFEYLDRTGNFFYERWGDAPVQTIAAALFLKKEQIHFFNDIGYTHSVATHCPYNNTLLKKCHCDVNKNFDFHRSSCTKKLLKLLDPKAVSNMNKFIKEKGIKL